MQFKFIAYNYKTFSDCAGIGMHGCMETWKMGQYRDLGLVNDWRVLYIFFNNEIIIIMEIFNYEGHLYI